MWFMHPSDAYMLGNMILGISDETEICQYSHQYDHGVDHNKIINNIMASDIIKTIVSYGTNIVTHNKHTSKL